MSTMPSRVIIECTDCGFQRATSPDDDEPPSDVIIDHGRATGHTLNLADRVE